MSGTMYRSPAPGEPPFVKEGDRVTKGQTIAIIEAMKLMNEIEVRSPARAALCALLQWSYPASDVGVSDGGSGGVHPDAMHHIANAMRLEHRAISRSKGGADGIRLIESVGWTLWGDATC